VATAVPVPVATPAGKNLVVWPPANTLPQAIAAPVVYQPLVPVAQISTGSAAAAGSSQGQGLYQGLAALRANMDALMNQAVGGRGVVASVAPSSVGEQALEAKIDQMSQNMISEERTMEAKLDSLENANSIMKKQLQQQAKEIQAVANGKRTIQAEAVVANVSTYATEPWDATFTVHLDGDANDGEAYAEQSTFVIRVHPEWAPEGAKRFQDMVRSGILNDSRFFRVLPGFMVQWGIPGDPKVAAEWVKKRIPDDPVIKSNTRGMVSFAMAGPNTRTTQMFINYGNNKKLDEQGFAPFAEVLGKGMKTVGKLQSRYKERPKQDKIWHDGNKYLQKHFPKLSYIGHVDSTLIDPLRKKASEELKVKKTKKPEDSEEDDDDGI